MVERLADPVVAQNIYDKPDFFAGYSRLGRSVHGLNGAAEWPAVRALIPDLRGKTVVDLGCGFGWFSRWAAEQGAESVLGVDLSENMIGRARADTQDSRIAYSIGDLSQLQLPSGAYDFAYSSLALHYLEDFDRLLSVVYQSLRSGSRFVFTIEHPIFMAASRAEWMQDTDGRKTWPVNQYAIEGERRTNWFVDGVVKYHRTMATTLNGLIAAGFHVLHVNEWSPTDQDLAVTPALSDEIDRPMMLIVSAGRKA